MALVMYAVNDSTRIFDRVTLVNGKLRFETGSARDMFLNMRRNRARLQGKHTSDIELYKAFTGWNNGYVTIQERG